ncbi:MAG: GNAT family N-acetyltransferase [Bacteroidales bacterium]|nr:GNAT family N-acetyltransferase [Bacteroidales bacterium]
MKIHKYGVTLKRITEEDIELLRQWRNSEQINRHMEYREYITPEMQKQWFDSINNYNNFYYLIIYKGDKVGVINEKNIDRSGKGTSESGLFIANKEYYKTFVPLLASLTLIEVNFYLLGGKESYIRTLRDNEEAIAYNKSLGYKLCEGQENVENQLYVLTRENYEQKTRKIRKAASRFTDSDYPNGYVLFEPHDYDLGIAQKFEKVVEKGELPVEVKIKETPEGKVFYY